MKRLPANPQRAQRWKGPFCRKAQVDLEDDLAAWPSWPATGSGILPFALAELLSRRGLERPCETLVAWAREA